MSYSMLNLSHEPEVLIKAISDLVEMFVAEVKLGKSEAHRNESLSTTAALKMVCLMRDIIRLFQISEARPSSVTIQMLCRGCPAMEVSSQQVCRLLFLIARTSDALLHSQVGTLLLMNVTRRVLCIVRDCAASNTATQTELEAHARVTLNHISDKRRVTVKSSNSNSSPVMSEAKMLSIVSKNERDQQPTAAATALSAVENVRANTADGATEQMGKLEEHRNQQQEVEHEEEEEEEGLLDDDLFDDLEEDDANLDSHERKVMLGCVRAHSSAARAKEASADASRGDSRSNGFHSTTRNDNNSDVIATNGAFRFQDSDEMNSGIGSPLRYDQETNNTSPKHRTSENITNATSSHDSPASLHAPSAFTPTRIVHAHPTHPRAQERSGSECSGNSDNGGIRGGHAAAPTSPAVVTHTSVAHMCRSTLSCEFTTPPPHLSESIIASEVPGQQTLRRAPRRRTKAIAKTSNNTNHNNDKHDNDNGNSSGSIKQQLVEAGLSNSEDMLLSRTSTESAGQAVNAARSMGEACGTTNAANTVLGNAAIHTDSSNRAAQVDHSAPSSSFFAYTPCSGSSTSVEFPVRLRRFYQDVLDGINEFRDEIESMNEELCRRVKKQLHSSDTVMTLGCSVTTRRYLLQAVKENKFLKVIILEGAPASPEAALSLATALQHEGCAVQVLPDSSAFAVMGMCTKVLLGAESVLANGGMLGPVGSHVICIAARHFSVPVLVATTTLKMSPFYPSDKLCTRLVRVARWVAQEMPWSTYGPAEQVLPLPYAGLSVRDGGRSLTVHSPVTEYVPPELIALYATNETELTPSQIHRIVRANYSDAD